MREIQTKFGKILVVEYPKEAYLIGTIDNPKFKYSIRFVDCPEINSIEYKELEPLGKLAELTDKDCEEFVTFEDLGYSNCWEDYYTKFSTAGSEYCLNTAKESFISLLKSEGIDTSKEHLIIKVL